MGIFNKKMTETKSNDKTITCEYDFSVIPRGEITRIELNIKLNEYNTTRSKLISTCRTNNPRELIQSLKVAKDMKLEDITKFAILTLDRYKESQSMDEQIIILFDEVKNKKGSFEISVDK